MRKIFLLLLIFLSSTLLFANEYYNVIMGQEYRPQSISLMGMGNAGGAIPAREKVFFTNPSFLGFYDSFSITIPEIDVSLYQARDILSSPIGKIFEGDIDAILSTVSNLNGTFPLILSDQSINTIFKHFGISLNAREAIYSTGQSFASGFIPSLQTTLTLSYGRLFQINDKLALASGVSEHISGVFYSSEISAETLSELLKGDSSALSFSSSTWSFSTDLALSLFFKNGLSFAFLFNGISSGINYINVTTGETYHSYSHSNITLSSAWHERITKHIEIAFAYDLSDIIGLLSTPSFDSFLYHSNIGAYVSFFDSILLSAGLNGGYPAFSLRLELFFLRLEALYRYQEFGSKVGINPKDQLQISLSIAFE